MTDDGSLLESRIEDVEGKARSSLADQEASAQAAGVKYHSVGFSQHGQRILGEEMPVEEIERMADDIAKMSHDQSLEAITKILDGLQQQATREADAWVGKDPAQFYTLVEKVSTKVVRQISPSTAKSLEARANRRVGMERREFYEGFAPAGVAKYEREVNRLSEEYSKSRASAAKLTSDLLATQQEMDRFERAYEKAGRRLGELDAEIASAQSGGESAYSLINEQTSLIGDRSKFEMMTGKLATRVMGIDREIRTYEHRAKRLEGKEKAAQFVLNQFYIMQEIAMHGAGGLEKGLTPEEMRDDIEQLKGLREIATAIDAAEQMYDVMAQEFPDSVAPYVARGPASSAPQRAQTVKLCNTARQIADHYRQRNRPAAPGPQSPSAEYAK